MALATLQRNRSAAPPRIGALENYFCQEMMVMSMGSSPQDHELLRAALEARSQARGGTAVDVYRHEGFLVLNADLPGIDPGSLSVELDGNSLLIRAHRSLRGMDSSTRWDVREREDGTILRRIPVGEGVEVSAAAPHYANGVLSLHLPLRPAGQQRSVPVQYSEQPGEAA
ncbi:Hsp20/alpha crystallin family protein [Arthrobacter gandavensis]|uniref:Hsp20/alpha crystallin family protein n=1 Tax=Arthrobacter gandavensis TaxID=169960 RepID=UPI001E449FD0|nr:Hsp20/alpha crystallin family protein [Arthrobacter gandavensis]MBF4995262.1 Hsp20/alpha crystallin family protein [Arthrobacter gandavensis]